MVKLLFLALVVWHFLWCVSTVGAVDTMIVREKTKDSSYLAVHLCDFYGPMSMGCYRACMKDAKKIFDYKIAYVGNITIDYEMVLWTAAGSERFKTFCNNAKRQCPDFYRAVENHVIAFNSPKKPWYKPFKKSQSQKYYKDKADQKRIKKIMFNDAISRLERKQQGEAVEVSRYGNNLAIENYFFPKVVDEPLPCNPHCEFPIDGRANNACNGVSECARGVSDTVTGPIRAAKGACRAGYNFFMLGMVDVPAECCRRMSNSLDSASENSDYIMIKRFLRGWSGGNFDVYYVDKQKQSRTGKKIYSVITKFTGDLHYNATTIKRYPGKLHHGWGSPHYLSMYDHAREYNPVVEAESALNMFSSSGWWVTLSWFTYNDRVVTGIFRKLSGWFELNKYELTWQDPFNPGNTQRALISETSSNRYRVVYEFNSNPMQSVDIAEFATTSASAVLANRWAIKVARRDPQIPEYLLFQMIGIIDRKAFLTGLGYI